METVRTPPSRATARGRSRLQRGRLSMETVRCAVLRRVGSRGSASTRPTLDGDGEVPVRRGGDHRRRASTRPTLDGDGEPTEVVAMAYRKFWLQRGRLSMETVRRGGAEARQGQGQAASTRPTLDGDGEEGLVPALLAVLRASTRPTLDGDGEMPTSRRRGGTSTCFNEADSRWRR